jgi:hypothetical protein
MSTQRHPALSRWDDKRIEITTQEELDLLLAFDGADLSPESIEFSLGANVDPHEVTPEQVTFVTGALDQVVSSGSLPAPREPLPPIGTKVEEIMTGGKPPPPSLYAVGVVESFEWDSSFRTWRVHVVFDSYAGKFYGNPIKGSSTFPWLLHVIGSEERPLSTMTPAEIEDLYQERRDEFWRTIDPKAGLSDPAGRVPPRGEA